VSVSPASSALGNGLSARVVVRLVLHRAEVWDRRIILEINGGIAETMPLNESALSRFGTPNWLPDEDSNLEPSG
jgi:hypothetical protein